jgi:hypothetical protein
LDTIELPTLRARASVKQAYDAMRRSGRSGVLINVEGQKRLIDFGALQAAQTRGVKTLHRVVEFQPVLLARRRRLHARDAIAEYLDAKGSSYLWAHRQSNLGVVFTRNENLAAALRLAPRVRHCTGPKEHEIPPTGLRADGTCRACGYPVS